MQPGYGIIGCGNISRFHFNGLEKAGAKIVHIADINKSAAEPYVQRYGTKFSTDWKDVVNDTEVTAVSILTSGKYHKDIAIFTLEVGKDVICEKTMTDNAKEAEQIVKTADSSDSLFFTAFMKRFFPAVNKVKEIIPSLGTLFSCNVKVFHKWINFYDSTELGPFLHVVDNYGGAVLKCAGSHMLDMMLYLIGRPKSVYAEMDYVPGTKFDRKATALFEYGSGLTVTYQAAAHPLSKIGFRNDSWDEAIKIYGINGYIEIYTVKWDEPGKNAALLLHYDNQKETVTEYRFDAVNPFDIEMDYFNKCLINRTQGSPSVVDGFNVDVIIDAMSQSSEKRISVTIDWRGIE